MRSRLIGLRTVLVVTLFSEENIRRRLLFPNLSTPQEKHRTYVNNFRQSLVFGSTFETLVRREIVGSVMSKSAPESDVGPCTCVVQHRAPCVRAKNQTTGTSPNWNGLVCYRQSTPPGRFRHTFLTRGDCFTVRSNLLNCVVVERDKPYLRGITCRSAL
jgi:hypothetical protein